MSTPETLTAPSNGPAIQSTAETVLAEAQSLVGSAEASGATATPTSDGEAPEGAEGAVEIEDVGDDGAPRKRNLSWSDAIKQVPPDIARLMKQMQGDYTRKTQELASERKNFLREREALMAGAKNLNDKGELPEYDPFNEDSIKARIEQEVTRRLREVLEPMQQEYEVMQAEDSYQSFLAEHPEFKTDKALRSEVQTMLEGNTSLDLETAYWAAKGKMAKIEAANRREKESAKRKAKKEAAFRGTGKPRKVSVSPSADRSSLRRMNNADLLALAQSMSRGS